MEQKPGVALGNEEELDVALGAACELAASWIGMPTTVRTLRASRCD
jgi:hypothetical protein